jgi:hypothetical protein
MHNMTSYYTQGQYKEKKILTGLYSFVLKKVKTYFAYIDENKHSFIQTKAHTFFDPAKKVNCIYIVSRQGLCYKTVLYVPLYFLPQSLL